MGRACHGCLCLRLIFRKRPLADITWRGRIWDERPPYQQTKSVRGHIVLSRGNAHRDLASRSDDRALSIARVRRKAGCPMALGLDCRGCPLPIFPLDKPSKYLEAVGPQSTQRRPRDSRHPELDPESRFFKSLGRSQGGGTPDQVRGDDGVDGGWPP